MNVLIAKMHIKTNLKMESKNFSAFFGTQLKKQSEMIELKQFGLIDRKIKATGMKDCNPLADPNILENNKVASI